jgi:hypothetical protein
MAALGQDQYAVFVRAAGVALQYGLRPAEVVGADAEALAQRPHPEGYAMAVKACWDFAAEAWRHAEDAEGQRRCRLRSVDMTLERARGAPSALAASHFLRAAIAELRTISDTHAQRVALERELRDRQRESVGEFQGSLFRYDLTDLATATFKRSRSWSYRRRC